MLSYTSGATRIGASSRGKNGRRLRRVGLSRNGIQVKEPQRLRLLTAGLRQVSRYQPDDLKRACVDLRGRYKEKPRQRGRGPVWVFARAISLFYVARNPMQRDRGPQARTWLARVRSEEAARESRPRCRYCRGCSSRKGPRPTE